MQAVFRFLRDLGCVAHIKQERERERERDACSNHAIKCKLPTMSGMESMLILKLFSKSTNTPSRPVRPTVLFAWRQAPCCSGSSSSSSSIGFFALDIRLCVGDAIRQELQDECLFLPNTLGAYARTKARCNRKGNADRTRPSDSSLEQNGKSSIGIGKSDSVLKISASLNETIRHNTSSSPVLVSGFS